MNIDPISYDNQDLTWRERELQDPLNVAPFLSQQERAYLTYINKTTNNLRDDMQKNTNFMGLTLEAIFTKWSLTMRQILDDILNLKWSNYSSYFQYVEDTGLWVQGIKKIIGDLWVIFIGNDRAIYSGMTIVIIAILLYLLDILE
jgi:hypothetical protein